jgi:hypothetical protein
MSKLTILRVVEEQLERRCVPLRARSASSKTVLAAAPSLA